MPFSLFPFSSSALRCALCHPKEVEGYSRSAMSRSLRRPENEPQGEFVHSVSGTKFTVFANAEGLWQRMERDGEVSENHVEYVVGSGNHASGYLVRIGDQLFQSPIAYYSRLKRYDMAPGYEEFPAPDFYRPITEECLLCHSGKPLLIDGTLNEYPSPAFEQESISCDRCHGDPARHLRAPLPGTIINPAKLVPAARNSICEQCHLKGIVRVLNPGKDFGDFHPGETLEHVYTVYTPRVPADSPREALKVVSHAEQLALSLCARRSNGRLWCGTCHNPHDQSQQPPQYYRSRCMSCHAGNLAKSHPQGTAGNCIACHMSKRSARDGGHTVFTDHRIARRLRPDTEKEIPATGDLIAWREPPTDLQLRNLALAYVSAGLDSDSVSQCLRGYRMLLDAEKHSPNDPAVLTGLARGLLAGHHAAEAAKLFEHVLELGPDTAMAEEDTGMAFMRAGQTDKALEHLERAVQLDPLLLPAAKSLAQIYRQQGETAKLDGLAVRVRQALGKSAPQAAGTAEH